VTFVLDHVDLTGDGVSLPAAVDAARGITPRAKRAATRNEVLGPMLDALPDDACGARDRAILAVAVASGDRRRSELVALRLADVTPAGRDFTLRIRRSKTDQQGAGADVPVKRAAADALRRWLRLLADQGITEGPLFRELSRRGRVVRRRGAEGGAKPLDGRVVAEMVKRAARAAGLDPAAYRRARRHPARPADAALRPQEPPHRRPLLPGRRRSPEPGRRPAVGERVRRRRSRLPKHTVKKKAATKSARPLGFGSGRMRT
jgi:hypothetical protein